uniref:B30.2/SPRY domain-containing protein n=1 Tax=Oreochromis niloticus TaxID=8128 RepID=I3KLM5_ORENI
MIYLTDIFFIVTRLPKLIPVCVCVCLCVYLISDYSQDGPQQQIVALLGDDVHLPCVLETPVDVSNMLLEWKKTDPAPGFIYVWDKKEENIKFKLPSYMGRTSLSFDKLKHGDISLTLSQVQLPDQGLYRCFVPELGQKSFIDLVVASTPVIKVMSNVSSRVVLQCESAGWYPEPELLWLDGEGNLPSAGPTETLRGPDDLYTVSSRVTVEKRHSNNITSLGSLGTIKDVTAAVSETRDKLQDILREEWTNISLTVTEEDVLLSPPEPKTRAGFLKYSHEITLDPNTANTRLLLSDGNRKVTRMKQQQSYSDHPDRFTGCYQVLSRESLTGRCYWEVEWRGRGVGVAVAYKNISRAGSRDECVFGYNDKSWALCCYTTSYKFQHNNVQTVLSGPQSSRVGVYLDHRAGILSFYSVSETMTLLHRVQTTFTQPLYVGLYLWDGGATADLCEQIRVTCEKFISKQFPLDPKVSKGSNDHKHNQTIIQQF